MSLEMLAMGTLVAVVGAISSGSGVPSTTAWKGSCEMIGKDVEVAVPPCCQKNSPSALEWSKMMHQMRRSR